jgi:aryl-alcohol dehydrogenase-like predicted oxidoreductase
MSKRPLGRSGLEIAPLVFGGNVFGWTADRLDAAAARGIGGYVAERGGQLARTASNRAAAVRC